MLIFTLRIIFIIYSTVSCFAASSLTTVKISLDYFLNPYHATLIVGIEKGVFKKHGIKLKILDNVGSSQGCLFVDQKAADFGVVIEPQIYIQQSKGLKIQTVVSLVPHVLEIMISHFPLSNIKGKRLGHASSGHGFTKAVIDEVLAQQNLTENDIEIIYAQKNLKRVFLANFVDAIVNVYYNYEIDDLINFMRQEKRPLYIYPFKKLGVPFFHSLVIIKHQNMPKDTEQKFIAALKESNNYITNTEPDELWKLIKKHKPELDTPSNQAAWNKIYPLLKMNFSSPSLKQQQSILKFLKKHHLMKE